MSWVESRGKERHIGRNMVTSCHGLKAEERKGMKAEIWLLHVMG